MKLNQLVATNLRRYCKQHSSIAEVCRGAGINRQQFNKYLAGRIVPSKRTIDRLCRYLCIEPAEIFQSDESPGQAIRGGTPSNAKVVRNVLGPFVAKMSRMSNSDKIQKVDGMPDGYYRCFFPVQSFPNHIVCATLKIKTTGDITTFARRTAFRSPTNKRLIIASGRHSGVAFSSKGEIHFLAINQTEPHHLSLMTVEIRQISENGLYLGIALTRGISEPFACRVCLQYVGSTVAAARQCLKGMGITSVECQDVSPIIVTALSGLDSQVPGQVSLSRFESMMVASGSLTEAA